MSFRRPVPAYFYEAAHRFDNAKPPGTRIAGVALVCSAPDRALWSVNYESDTFVNPHRQNIPQARAAFQAHSPPGTAVSTVCVCTIQPRGLIINKWQVTYLVNDASDEKLTVQQLVGGKLTDIPQCPFNILKKK